MKRWIMAAAVIAAAGCGTEVDVDGLPSTDGFENWLNIEVTGETPGHGDSFRIIFYNGVAAEYAGAGQYPVGTVLVKEIRVDEGGEAGDLSYLGIMRRIGVNADDPPGGANDGGWLFTVASDADDDSELYFPSCWSRCHIQGPIDGAWFDYGLAAAEAGR